MWNPFKKAQKKETKEEKKEKARSEALKKLEELKRKKNKEELLTELSAAVRQFFKNFYGIRYAFTSEELNYELDKRRIDPYLKKKAKRILDRLSETQYNIDHSEEEIKKLLKDVKELIQLL